MTLCVLLVVVYMHMGLCVFIHALTCECFMHPTHHKNRHTTSPIPGTLTAAGLSCGYADVTAGVKYEF